MEFQLKQIHCQPCIWGIIQKDKKLDAPFSNTHHHQHKKTRVEEGEIENGIINNEAKNQIESTTKLSSSVVLDEHY